MQLSKMRFGSLILFILALVFFNSWRDIRKKEKIKSIIYLVNLEVDLVKENAHPVARNLLVEDFFWDITEETSPFGNDTGSDASYNYIDWRKSNRNSDVVSFLRREIESFDFPPFDIESLDSEKIQRYIRQSTSLSSVERQTQKQQILENSNDIPKDVIEKMGLENLDKAFDIASIDMGLTYLTELDNAIISVGFGQWVTEGKVDLEMLKLTKIAINRQLKPFLLSSWGNDYWVS